MGDAMPVRERLGGVEEHASLQQDARAGALGDAQQLLVGDPALGEQSSGVGRAAARQRAAAPAPATAGTTEAER
jgi:hypothetical protein